VKGWRFYAAMGSILRFCCARHGFDHATLRALRNEGSKCSPTALPRSINFAAASTWIPQQLWRPVKKKKGLWTICVHSNFANAAQVCPASCFPHSTCRAIHLAGARAGRAFARQAEPQRTVPRNFGAMANPSRQGEEAVEAEPTLSRAG